MIGSTVAGDTISIDTFGSNRIITIPDQFSYTRAFYHLDDNECGIKEYGIYED